MDAKIRDKWLAELRSGDDQRARYALHVIKRGMLGFQTLDEKPVTALQLRALANDSGRTLTEIADYIEANL